MPPIPKGITPPRYWYPRTEWPSRQEAQEAYDSHAEVLQTSRVLEQQFSRFQQRNFNKLRSISKKIDKQYQAMLRFIRKKIAPVWLIDTRGNKRGNYAYYTKQLQQHSRSVPREIVLFIENLDLLEETFADFQDMVAWLDQKVYAPTVPQVHPLIVLDKLDEVRLVAKEMVGYHHEVCSARSGLWHAIDPIARAWDTLIDYTDERYDPKTPDPAFIVTVLDVLPGCLPDKGTGPLDIDLPPQVIRDLHILMNRYNADFSRHFVERPK